eukprot:5237738-Heterocapsa_arctica.AAC.1
MNPSSSPRASGASLSVAQLAGVHRGHQVASSVAHSGTTSLAPTTSSVRARHDLVQEQMAAEFCVLEMKARMIQRKILNDQELQGMPDELERNSSQDGVDEELQRERVPQFFGIADQD